MTKLFYIVDHYVPFPSSEFDLITSADDGDFNQKFYAHLRENILNSRTYALAENLESKIVEEFTT